MKFKITITALIVGLVCGQLFATNIEGLIAKYKANQHKIKTLVANGTTAVSIKGADGKVLTESASDIGIVMKYPDLFKMVIKSPVLSTVVQKGNQMTQKIGGNSAITRKVEAGSDLFKKYFAYEIGDTIDPSRILSEETVTEGGETLTRFLLKIEASTSGSAEAHLDRMELCFNANGMITRQVMYSGITEVVRVETHYVVKDTLYLADQIMIRHLSGGIVVSNTMKYSALSVNQTLSDKEFEIK